MDLSFVTVITAALPVFLMVGAGFVLRRLNVLTEEADSSIMKMVIQVLLPCLYLDFVIGNPALDNASNLIAAPLVGFLTLSGGFLFAYLFGRLMGLQIGKGLRTFSFGNGIYNYGFIPIPVIIALFDDRGTLGVLVVHNVGIEIAIWTIGIMLLAGEFQRKALRNVINPPIIALVIALIINATGMDSEIPAWLTKAISMLAACAVPLGIMLAGALIADLMQRQKILADWKVVSGSVLVRLALLPIAFVLIAAFLPGISDELRRVIVIQAAMPAGILPIVLARHYGGDASVSVRIVVATNLASIATMPLWIHIGLSYAL